MAEQIDRLSGLLDSFGVRAHLFHAGPLCGITRFAAEPGRGFLHVMRSGSMRVSHRQIGQRRRHFEVREPSLLFYPNPLSHDFHNEPTHGADFACATVQFDGGNQHPLARALPAVIVLPLQKVSGLESTLALLFAETEQVRCGQRLLADRLFDVLLLQLLRWLLDHPSESKIPAGLLTGLAHPQLAKALVAVHEQPGIAWNLQRMALVAGMSRSAFATTFKHHVNATPGDYLVHWRLSITQRRLRSGDSLKTIAHELGYANASALSRVFTQKVGVSPREWLAHPR